MADDRLEVSADGAAIGTVCPSPNGDDAPVVCAPSTFDESTGMVARMEHAMLPDTVLDGKDPQLPQEVTEKIFPGYFNSDKRLKAVELYVTGKYSIPLIADEIGVPERTVVKWAEVGNWVGFNEALVDTMKKHERARITAMRVRERERAINEQVELGHKIAEVGKTFIETAETAGQFKAAAEGVKLGSDMVGRALAINESGKMDAEEKKSEADGGARPLVMVFGAGGLPPQPKETLDV